MRNKSAVLALVMLFALVTATPVLAGHGNGGGGQPSFFSLAGNIIAVDGNTITVNALNDRFAGQVLTVQVTSSTSFLMWTADGRVPITFDKVKVGQSVNIKGTIDSGIFIASQVTVDVPLYCIQ